MHDLPAVAGRMRETRAFQRREMEGERGRGHCQAGGDLAGGEAVRAFGDQQAHEVEPGLLRQGREGCRRLPMFPFFQFSRNDWLCKGHWEPLTPSRAGVEADSGRCHRKFTDSNDSSSSRKYRHAGVPPLGAATLEEDACGSGAD